MVYMPLEIPRGTRDYGPKESIRLKDVISRTEQTFRRFGFYPIITPAIEKIEVLNSKIYGSDANNEIYLLDGKEAGLRYDLTVPTARYVAMNKGTALPFKRYMIAEAWRRDEPQYMRSREFIQADIDVIGSSEISAEAEVIAASATALENLGITDYTIMLNHRVILSAIMDTFAIPKDKQIQTMRILDKLAKISSEEILKQMTELGISNDISEQMLNFIKVEEGTEQKLTRIEANITSAKAPIADMRELISLLDTYKIKGKIVVDLSIIRGIDYYTGMVWEITAAAAGKKTLAIGSGGRYDGLIEKYSNIHTPAVGSSIGISRVVEFLKAKSGANTYADVYVAYLGKEAMKYAIEVANIFRESGINADLNMTPRNISKQLEYVNSLEIKYVCIIGPSEVQTGLIMLKNMFKEEEVQISPEDAVTKIKAGM